MDLPYSEDGFRLPLPGTLLACGQHLVAPGKERGVQIPATHDFDGERLPVVAFMHCVSKGYFRVYPVTSFHCESKIFKQRGSFTAGEVTFTVVKTRPNGPLVFWLRNGSTHKHYRKVIILECRAEGGNSFRFGVYAGAKGTMDCLTLSLDEWQPRWYKFKESWDGPVAVKGEEVNKKEEQNAEEVSSSPEAPGTQSVTSAGSSSVTFKQEQDLKRGISLATTGESGSPSTDQTRRRVRIKDEKEECVARARHGRRYQVWKTFDRTIGDW